MNYHQLQSIRLLQQGHGAVWLREDMESRTDTYCIGGDVSAVLQLLHRRLLQSRIKPAVTMEEKPTQWKKNQC